MLGYFTKHSHLYVEPQILMVQSCILDEVGDHGRICIFDGVNKSLSHEIGQICLQMLHIIFWCVAIDDNINTLRLSIGQSCLHLVHHLLEILDYRVHIFC